MKKRYIRIITVTILILIFTVIGFADTWIPKPEKRLTYTVLSQPKIHYIGTVKDKKDNLQTLIRTKKDNNPEVILYNNKQQIDLHSIATTYSDPFSNVGRKRKYSIITVIGECKDYYITNNNYYVKIDEVQDIQDFNYKNDNKLYRNFVEKDGNVDDEIVAYANEYIEKIPLNIRQKFVDNGWKIYVTDKNLSKLFCNNVYNSIAGVTLYDEKIIYIEDRKNAVKLGTVHEIGHAIDEMLNTISYSQEFEELYNLEKNNFIEKNNINTDYARQNDSEYFAELFQQTILYPDSCKVNSPKSYEYMNNLIENIQ